jgi:hypothetical protein
VLRGANLDWTIRQTLDEMSRVGSPIERPKARESVALYLNLLVRLRNHITSSPGISVGEAMSWILENSGYVRDMPQQSGSNEENPDDREASVRNFVAYATQTQLEPADFIAHLASLDTTCGLPDSQCVKFTSIHRAKGLEADYVFLPGCDDGVMPIHSAGPARGLGGMRAENTNTGVNSLESERRLFYVAVTRASRQLYIGTGGSGTGAAESPFLAEMELEATRMAVRAFWDVLHSKARSCTDAVCHMFLAICAKLAPSEKVTSYTRRNYVDELKVPLLREKLEEAMALGELQVRGGTPPSQARGPSTGVPIEIQGLYHVTHITNLPSVFALGLQCRSNITKIPGCKPFYDGSIRRRSDPVPETGKLVADYVPLSFCARSPFLHDLMRRSGHRGVRDDYFAILLLDGTSILSIPGTIYSERDICVRPVFFHEATELPAHVNWSAVAAREWPDELARAAKAAEFLVPGTVPSKFVTSILLPSSTALGHAQDILWKARASSRDSIRELTRCLELLHVDESSFFPESSS